MNNEDQWDIGVEWAPGATPEGVAEAQRDFVVDLAAHFEEEGKAEIPAEIAALTFRRRKNG